MFMVLFIIQCLILIIYQLLLQSTGMKTEQNKSSTNCPVLWQRELPIASEVANNTTDWNAYSFFILV